MKTLSKQDVQLVSGGEKQEFVTLSLDLPIVLFPAFLVLVDEEMSVDTLNVTGFNQAMVDAGFNPNDLKFTLTLGYAETSISD